MAATPDLQPQRLWIMGKDASGNVQPPFDFDGVLNESHTSKLAIMENPVETGVIVADHAFMLPRELEIVGVVSDVWVRMRGDQTDGARAQQPGDLVKDKDWLVPSDGGGGSSRRDARAFRLLLGLQASANPFSVQTGLRLYANMLLVELTANQDARTASYLRFTAKLREVLINSTKTRKYTPRADKATEVRAAKKTKSGDKQAVTPPEEKRASVLLRGGRAVAGR